MKIHYFSRVLTFLLVVFSSALFADDSTGNTSPSSSSAPTANVPPSDASLDTAPTYDSVAPVSAPSVPSTSSANTLPAHTSIVTPVAPSTLTSNIPNAVPTTPKEQVESLVQQAVQYAKEHGEEAALLEFNREGSPFRQPNMYVFAINFKGDILANGGDPDMIGNNHYDLKDPKGRSIVRALIEKARYGDGAWVNYYWKNPETKQDECKSSFVTTVDKKFVIGVGFHHPLNAKGECIE